MPGGCRNQYGDHGEDSQHRRRAGGPFPQSRQQWRSEADEETKEYPARLREQNDQERHGHERSCRPTHPHILRLDGSDRQRQSEHQERDGPEIVGIGVHLVPDRPAETRVAGNVVCQCAARRIDHECDQDQEYVEAQLLRRA